MSRIARRSGFTVVELLAVAGAVAVMGTQLAAAIQEARENARRAQCKANLKQIGLAMHNYHDTFVALPPGWIGADSQPKQPNVLGLNGWGWCAFLSPFMDQAPMFNTINYSSSIADPKNTVIAGKPFAGPRPQSPPLRCVSDPFVKKTWTLKDAKGEVVAEVAASNYAASFGTADFSKCEKMKPGEVCAGDGVFFHNSKTRIADITDGTSNTFAAGERAFDEKTDRATTWSGVFPKAKSPFGRILGTSDQALNAKEKNASGYGSPHKDGTHFTMLDGSVRFIKADLDLKVLQALTTRSGGEVIPQD